MEKLTKKNQEFIYIATHQLKQDGKTDEDIKKIIDEITPTILEQQEKGIPARTFLGAPTTWAAHFSQPKQATTDQNQTPKNTKPLLMWLDSSLFFLAVITLIQGVLLLTSKNQVPQGIITILTTGIIGGGVMYLTYHFFYRHLGQNSQTPINYWKNIVLMVIYLGVLVLLVSLTSLLPTHLNPTLPPVVLLIIAGVSFLSRYVIKKKYNIQSSFGNPRP